MAKEVAKILTQRRGMPVYDSNPSIPTETEIKKGKRSQIGTETKGLVVDTGTGEILGHGGAIAYEWEEVDKERFVKLYLAGLKQASGLTKVGLELFEEVYRQMQEVPEKDTVNLSQLTSGMTKDRFYRGLKELLEQEFLFHSPFEGVFFVNIRFIFNGDRLAFVKAYKLKGSNNQSTLPLFD